MKPERILFPIDVRRCPLDLFPLVNRVASRTDVAVSLLHVVTLNILAPESRVYEELVAETRWFLQRLAREYLPAAACARTQVRVGNASEEILTEAKEGGADLMILASHGASLWRRVTCLWQPPGRPAVSPHVAKIIHAADCGLFIAPSRVRFDCEREWGRPSKESLSHETGTTERQHHVPAASPDYAAYAPQLRYRRFQSMRSARYPSG